MPLVPAVDVNLLTVAENLDDDTFTALIADNYKHLACDYLYQQAEDLSNLLLNILAGRAQQLCFLDNGPGADNVPRMENVIKSSIFSNQMQSEIHVNDYEKSFTFLYSLCLNFPTLK
jgi:hypothetical protein